ncbi:1-hydroxycarotenoid 3,4-desaturase CrtD [Roseivivax isoporae]|uniref:Methoxyneurosporene dehydrogenase n=1 Tax=Roseivivax isoporae LMG 25204 TaxID=1449351 RepID=X7FC47_9RHOB|nr:1-hydroxycarotenoid 3,4-desaturase CrtD [Roseivivax isoporae]ETX29604.1 methoxyneurosporene dehydrogenase [Roseivivax isoporae LMG 25204]
MTHPKGINGRGGPVVVIGAGIGGLAAALRLASAGLPVTVVERHATPGGKMRQVDGVDAGPTVLTMRPVFDALFAAAGTTVDAHLNLVPQPILARHFWTDGATLDLHADPERSAAAVRDFAGPRGEAQFRAFSARARALFEGFEPGFMQAPEPSLTALARHVAARPRLALQMAPWASLAGLLGCSFSDRRLAQLFGRYATYVGGLPGATPALLSLIWHAEASGVWAIEGGMSRLARVVAGLVEQRGGQLVLGTGAERILTDSDGVTGVRVSDGRVLPAAQVVFNGDPRALALGLLGPGLARAAPGPARAARSLSARVWSFRARWQGPDIVHHNVFFRDDPAPEFRALGRGRIAPDPTLYLCAEDRTGAPQADGAERFEIIVNAAPLTRAPPQQETFEACQARTFGMLDRFGARMAPMPGPRALTTPEDFEALFPGSAGSLYGQSPHGTLAAFARPVARTRVPGLVLAGGGVHPGPGVPMAALSGAHAAAAILQDRASRSPSRRTATRGGTSTASATTGPAHSRSSPS